MNGILKKPAKKRNRITIGEFKTPPKTQKYLIIDVQDSPSSPVSRRQKVSIGSSSPRKSHNVQKSPVSRRQKFSIGSPSPRKLHNAPDSRRQKLSIGTSNSQNLNDGQNSNSTRQSARILIGSPSPTKLFNVQKSPVSRRQKFSIGSPSPTKLYNGQNSNLTLQHRRILIGSPETPESERRERAEMFRRLTDGLPSHPISTNNRSNFDLTAEPSSPTSRQNLNSTLQHARILIASPESPRRRVSEPIISHRRQIFIGSAASPDPSERQNPESPTTQHQGLHGGLDILHRIQEMRRSQTRFKISVEPKNIAFICGINRFSDENYEYMIRVNSGTTNLSTLIGPIELQIHSFDVSPISSFKHPVLLANVTYEGNPTQDLMV